MFDGISSLKCVLIDQIWFWYVNQKSFDNEKPIALVLALVLKLSGIQIIIIQGESVVSTMSFHSILDILCTNCKRKVN